MTKRFEGKVAIVTGGGSGIGEATAKTMAADGAKVVIADFDERNGNRVVSEIEAAGGTAMFVKVDVSVPEQQEAMVARTMDTYGRLDIAVNNAGIGGEANLTGEYGLESWRKVIDINLIGVFYGLRYEIPAMLKSGGGAIVNMASILGSVGFAMSSAYVAAKHGVVGLTKSAAMEYAKQGIRINSVGPAFINTPLVEKNMDAESRAALVSMHPLGRLGEAQEVANLVCFLCSNEASFMTGSYYLVDGAYTAH